MFAAPPPVAYDEMTFALRAPITRLFYDTDRALVVALAIAACALVVGAA